MPLWTYRRLFLAYALFLFLFPLKSEAGFQLSGGVDARYKITDGGDKAELEGIFINVRKVFSDETGDRWIFVGQVDAEKNLNEIRSYQTYLQYKGPLGKWNLRGGHYILPYGLLADYDTERLLIQTLEGTSLGIKLDTGIEILGQTGAYGYALSVSQGVGRERLSDVDENKLLVGRVTWEGEDTKFGLSGLTGKVLEENGENPYKSRLGADITSFQGSLTIRGELNIGREEDNTVGGGILLADYALLQKLESNFKAAYWHKETGRYFVAAGATYNLYQRLFLRIADEYEFRKGGDENVFMVQFYWDFFKQI